MMADVKSGQESAGQLVIYPQGTRVAPGDIKPYKIGTAALYGQLGQNCAPVATNAGIFWPKRSLLRKPGLAVVEFLAPIAPGLTNEQFMAQLEHAIEAASNRLMDEAKAIKP
jgi:1-acyl-sn-glycerol-3-phosphate acyltransferase